MSQQRRWLDSRHLRSAPEGRHALGRLEHLPEDRQRAILERADLLAEQSVSLAHAYFIAAVPAYQHDARRALDWEQSALAILGPDGANRAAALAYFALDPIALGGLPVATRAAWTSAIAELGTSSPRLAASFVETLGDALIARAVTTAEVVTAWHTGVTSLVAGSRWRGEFLATRLLESARTLVSVLDERGVASWTRFVAAVGRAARSPRAPDVPEDLLVLDPTLGSRVLDVGASAAEIAPNAAAGLLAKLAHAAACLPPRAASALLDAVTVAGAEAGLVEALSLFAASARRLSPADAEVLVGHAPSVARRFPRGLPAFLRTLERAYEEGSLEGVELWIGRGLDLARHNEKAAIAHFRLESRTSHKILIERSAAVAFEEIEAVMQRYALMMARRSLHLAPGGGVWLRPPLAAPEDRLVRLPERIDLFETSEENQLFYKLAVAHGAARWQYGTYDFRRDRLEADQSWLDGSDDALDIIALIDAFPNPLLAAGLFVVLDGARVDAALEREFPGLAADLDRMGRLYAAMTLPAADRLPEEVIEALFLMTVARRKRHELPARMRASAKIAERAVGELRAPGATVYDSARWLLALYRSLALASALAVRDDDLSTFLEIGGATILDPLEHLDDGEAGAGTAASDKAKPTPAEPAGDVEEQQIRIELSHEEPPTRIGGVPLSPEEIRRLIEQGVDLQISEGRGEEQAGLGLYVTELLGKLPTDKLERLRKMISSGDAGAVRAWLASERGNEFHYYDEWDYTIGDYRRNWCRLAEVEVDGDGGRYVGGVIVRTSDLIGRIRREFQLMRPEQFRKVRGMEDGEDFDINALVEAHADRRTRTTPSDRLYVARRREERDVATLFLIDMSASTDEPVTAASNGAPVRRVIDVTKDTLVVMSSVLHEIGDAYAIYGFSGHGRENVEYYHVKTFNERWGPTVRARIGGIEPKRSTRMGAALRHAARKLDGVAARARHLILLSDGFPQDHDYGEDRRSNVYGIQDTMTALQELERRGVKTFCITVDPAGHDYLSDMCPAARYAVIDDIEVLPEELPRIYRTVTRY